MKENEIKIRLIDCILDSQTNEKMIVGNEVRFFCGSRRADIVALTEDSAIAFEIKGESGSTERHKFSESAELRDVAIKKLPDMVRWLYPILADQRDE